MGKKKIPDEQKALSGIIAMGVLLFCYTAFRACTLSFSWDESYSYLEFVRHHWWLPHEFNTMAANDHLLNTWLMKICASLFGIYELSLRLPNLAAHLLYLFFSAKIAMQMGKNFLPILTFILLNFNPYLLDFFSAARGYGLSMGLMMASLYFIFSFANGDKKIFPLFGAVFFSALAALANLTLLPFFIAVSFSI